MRLSGGTHLRVFFNISVSHRRTAIFRYVDVSLFPTADPAKKKPTVSSVLTVSNSTADQSKRAARPGSCSVKNYLGVQDQNVAMMVALDDSSLQ